MPDSHGTPRRRLPFGEWAGRRRDAAPVSNAMRRVHVVPHTHWDREWYMTFGNYRAILVDLVDGLMDILDSDSDFRSFTFDGQVAPIDDYLETLPESVRASTETRLRRLISDGRIQIGPWYTLSDQFLVSGETTLRNLQRGIARARELGGLMDIAYCPDQFGLIAELPKILVHAGISRAIGERGMHRDMPERFLWKGSDGATVEVVNLKDGYYQKRQTVRTLRNVAAKARGKAALFLAGYDHSVPDGSLATTAKAAGARMSSLPEYWADLEPLNDPHVHVGEIRSAGPKNLLPNVISNRVDQRLEVARAERMLERYAEPLAASAYDVYPSTLLDQAWRNQIWNAAHDSACATGIDEVTRQVRVRARETVDTAEGISKRALTLLGKRMRDAGDYVWNPSNFERDLSVRDARTGLVRTARNVPALGWARLDKATLPVEPAAAAALPAIRFEDQTDRGDTYTFDPDGAVRAVTLPLRTEQRDGEPFTRLRVAWENRDHDHRTRIVIKLPEPATGTTVDTAFGSLTRPPVPDPVQGRDRNNGFPAGKFIVAGGLAILLDRVAEYELLPETNELAITLVRAHGALSVAMPKFRPGGAGPLLPTHGTQMHDEIAWDLAVMPWDGSQGLPWHEWERFMLEPLQFHSDGGGSLPPRGTRFQTVPDGVLSAVIPGVVRSFEAGGAHRIVESSLVLADPVAEPPGPALAA